MDSNYTSCHHLLLHYSEHIPSFMVIDSVYVCEQTEGIPILSAEKCVMGMRLALMKKGEGGGLVHIAQDTVKL